MTHRRFSIVRTTTPLFAGSILLMVAWASPAPADGGGTNGGVFKFVGASYSQELRFAACMRRHGEPNFPDPNGQGVFSVRVDLNSPQYLRAQTACQYLLPRGHPLSPAQQAAALHKAFKFTQCMRANGVKNFPDPKVVGGGLSFSLAGVDPNSRLYQRAAKACQDLSPGGGLFDPEP